MRPVLILIPLFLLLAGCASAPVGTTSPAASPAATPVVLTSGPFRLTIDSPEDGATVPAATVELKGSVSADAVLTIDQNTYNLKAGPFAQTVTLEQGPNAVQIVASDIDGNEVDLILTITYQP